ncbi:efflux RND transporter periplasmic adaptor subunit [uncultured Rhodospira sp.]|uniref:efflux RND transporter periplasmic adaptor subunit n=1 Tax=uncultured Rhodospira sp. TaxID=1936189 RepID=UPI002623EB3C|nr:efflux RND transporter periplasmic adaptor subunit [uncultured Rhodospira sp.]
MRNTAGRRIAGRRWSWLAVACLGGALLVVPGPGAVAQQGGEGDGPRATPVGVATVSERATTQTVPVVGRLVPRRAGMVAAKGSGAVEHMAVDVGDVVEAGDLLARLDTESVRLEVELARAEVQQREAALEEARSRLALAQQELERLASLRRSAAFSQARYDDKSEEATGLNHSVSVAQAALTIARARLSLAEVALRDAEIRAPYPGTITERHTEVGAYVTKGAPVVALLNHLDLEVEADIPFDLVDGLSIGEAVDVFLDDETQTVAALRALVPAEDTRTRTRPARLTLPAASGPERHLAAGQSVTLMIPEGPARTVVTVPKDAVINKPTGNMVFVVVDGVAQPRPVDLGPAVGDAFAVRDGLSLGETVVTRGNERLRPGQPVRATVPPSARGTGEAGDGSAADG